MLASLPMYDLPEVRGHTDAWWQHVALALKREGIEDVPVSLERVLPTKAVWRDPNLLLTQTCGYPLRHEFADVITAVAVPHFDATGCDLGEYSSAIVVHDGSVCESFADLEGMRLAANAPDSQSGLNCVRDLIGEVGYQGAFFARIVWTGSHRQSLAAVRSDVADVAAIDAITLALLRNYAPDELSGVRILRWSRRVPGLPYATHAPASAQRLKRLRAGLMRAAHDEAAKTCREALLIKNILPIVDADYEPIVAMRRRANGRRASLTARTE